MKKFVTRAIIIALIGSTGILSGCYGPFRLTTKLHQWNGNVSNKKFVNELVFLGLCVLPAYELCTLGDVLIFNSIEFWGGQNPITMKDGQIDESEFMHEGKMYKVIKSKNNMTVALKDTDVKVDFRYFPEESTWYQMNGNEKVQVVKLKGKKVYTYLPNDKVLVFDENSVNTVESEVMAAR